MDIDDPFHIWFYMGCVSCKGIALNSNIYGIGRCVNVSEIGFGGVTKRWFMNPLHIRRCYLPWDDPAIIFSLHRKEFSMPSDWTLALEQQTDLSVTHGSAEKLADAVRRGADLRLYMTTDRYEETIYFQQTYAGEGKAFAGLMSHHHGYVHHGKDVEQPNMSIFKYDTSGTFSHVKWLWGDRAFDESQAYPYGIYRWFVCDRWHMVYEHDADGNRIDGDLEVLKEHIRTGRTIQVGIQQLFGIAEDQTNGPTHISYLDTMQALIQDGHGQSNCDLVVVGAPAWPLSWQNGVHIALIRPSTSGEMLCFLAKPGGLPFTRMIRRRAIRWMVAEEA